MSDYKTPKDLRYSEEHEWVRIEGDLAVVGITDYAQQKLGDVTYVELPEPGGEVEEMGEMCVVESVKAAADVYAPISGKLAEVNSALEDEPQVINQDCYGAGWLVKIKGFDQEEVENLMDAASYQDFVSQGRIIWISCLTQTRTGPRCWLSWVWARWKIFLRSFLRN